MHVGVDPGQKRGIDVVEFCTVHDPRRASVSDQLGGQPLSTRRQCRGHRIAAGHGCRVVKCVEPQNAPGSALSYRGMIADDGGVGVGVMMMGGRGAPVPDADDVDTGELDVELA